MILDYILFSIFLIITTINVFRLIKIHKHSNKTDL